jgi:hypothetical protein
VPADRPLPRSRDLAPGLELKGAGALVPLPPSLHPSGVRYAWEVAPSAVGGDCEPARAPDWMTVLPPAPERRPSPAAGPRNGEATPYGAAALLGELERVARAEAGGRNAALYRAAVRLAELSREGHVELEAAGRRLHGAAADVGLDRAERRATIRSAFEKAGVA